jgi:hypothetical protein
MFAAATASEGRIHGDTPSRTRVAAPMNVRMVSSLVAAATFDSPRLSIGSAKLTRAASSRRQARVKEILSSDEILTNYHRGAIGTLKQPTLLPRDPLS